MKLDAKNISLPYLMLTEVVSDIDIDIDAIAIIIPNFEDPSSCESYYVKPKLISAESERRNGKPHLVKHHLNFFPVVMDSHGTPWAEAVVYVLSRLESDTEPVMSTYKSIAEDLSAYRRFLDETEIEWTHFPSMKLARPTYRFKSHLKILIRADEISAGTANRRIRNVVKFYRHFIIEKNLVPAHPPWQESVRYITFKDSRGFDRKKFVVSTDLTINIPKQYNPYDGFIDDGGKLRPLPEEEQNWLMDALYSLGNTEMMLIHLLGILTAARIQTACTFRVRHVKTELKNSQLGEVRVPVGPGTGIDTKYDKQFVLHIPDWFYQMLHVYVNSERAKKRRERAIGGDNDDQLLFLSINGAPLYQLKEDLQSINENNQKRHIKTGQAVRQFITEKVIPFIRNKYLVTEFAYRFHDTRATAGMNWTDQQLKLVAQGKATLHEAREFVKVRMAHNSSSTTDRYLQYRQNLKLVRWIGVEYESRIKTLCQRAMEGLF